MRPILSPVRLPHSNDFLRESAHLRILSMYKFSLRHVDRGLMMWKHQTNEVLAIVSHGVDGRH
jgi:hypothetical protein